MSDTLDCPLYLEVNGRSFGGWLRVSVERSATLACTQWGVIATRVWQSRWIGPGDKVKVRIDQHDVCTGWVDNVSPAYDKGEHKIEISGRGLVCDLVDCSHVGEPVQWKNTEASIIIEALCEPFKVPVKIETDLGKAFDNFQIQQGETAWSAIERICRLRQVIAYDQPDGSLLITRVSEEVCPTPLVQGGNVLIARAVLDDKDRFSHYIVKGQQKAAKADKEVSPLQAAQSRGEVTDESMRRYRPMLLVQGADSDNDTALDRAMWEKQQRWGNGRSAEITLQGWLQPNGDMWPLNRLVDVDSPWLDLDRRLCITGVVLEAGAHGLRTILTVQPPEALTPAPPSVETTPKSSPGGGDGMGYWDQIRVGAEAEEQRRKTSRQ